MTEVAVAEKTKIILVGGMDYNVPDELKERFDIVKHITQGAKYNSLPQADYIFVITQWASHNVVDVVKKEAKAPIVWLPQGWAGMKETLQKRSMLPPDAPEVAQGVPKAASAEPSSTMGLSEAEIWKKFGEKMVEACRTVLKLGEKVSEKELLEVLSMAGPPTEDCKLFLPRLQMLGVVVPTKNGLWRLASSDSESYEEESEQEAAPLARERKREAPLDRPESQDRRRIPGNPAIVTRLIAGLRQGPYPTKKSIYVEMRKYQEFGGLTENQVKLAVERAIVQKIVDDTHESLFIDHKDDLQLTLIEQPKIEEDEPVVPKVLPMPETSAPFTTPPVSPPSGMSQQDAQKKWCFVVERVNQIRQRLGDILQHCRIEWMGTNNVLVICIPPVLANCQKFVESMENWGAISRTVQDHFTRDTVIRFMLDNGLRA